METNAVMDLGITMATVLGGSIYEGIDSAYSTLDASDSIVLAQESLASVLLLFVGIASLFYVGRWLYKAFKRGAA